MQRGKGAKQSLFRPAGWCEAVPIMTQVEPVGIIATRRNLVATNFRFLFSAGISQIHTARSRNDRENSSLI